MPVLITETAFTAPIAETMSALASGVTSRVSTRPAASPLMAPAMRCSPSMPSKRMVALPDRVTAPFSRMESEEVEVPRMSAAPEPGPAAGPVPAMVNDWA